MSGKMGKKPTGRKPTSVRRQSAKTTGAFGKEGDNQVATGTANENMDKAVQRRRAGGGA